MGMMAPDTNLMDAAAVARVLGISRSTLTRLVRAGSIPAVRFGPRGHLRFDAEDVRHFIARAKVVR